MTNEGTVTFMNIITYMRSTGFALLLFIIAAPSTLYSQEDVVPVRTADSLPSVDAILDRYVSALGGKEAIEKLTTRVRKGTVEITSVAATGTMERYQKAPNKLKAAEHIPGYGTIQTVFDGNVAWYERPEIPLQRPKAGWLADIKRQADFYWPLNLKQIFPTLKLKGKTLVGRRAAYLVEAIPAEGSTELLYFDVKTELLIRQDIKTVEGTQTVTTLFEDYREVDGIMLVFMIRQGPMTIRYSEVKHNVAIDDSLFDKPEQH